VGIARETTYGTAVAPAARYEVTSENLKLDIERVESKALGKRYLTAWAPGKRNVEGDIELEIPSAGFGRWLRAATGAAPSTTTDSPVAGLNTHLFSGESNIGASNESLTVEIQRTDVARQDHRFIYEGMSITEFELSAAVGEFAMAKFTMIGEDMSVTAASAQSASYATSTPLVFTGATVTVGSTTRSVKEMSFKTNQGLADDRYFLGTNKRSLPVEAKTREAEGTLKIEWTALTDWNRYLASNSVAIVATFETQAALTGSTKGSIEVSIPYARIDGEQPVSSDGGIIEIDVSFKVLDEGASDPFKITLVDTTSSY
jgi:hypothetical protein